MHVVSPIYRTFCCPADADSLLMTGSCLPPGQRSAAPRGTETWGRQWLSEVVTACAMRHVAATLLDALASVGWPRNAVTRRSGRQPRKDDDRQCFEGLSLVIVPPSRYIGWMCKPGYSGPQFRLSLVPRLRFWGGSPAFWREASRLGEALGDKPSTPEGRDWPRQFSGHLGHYQTRGSLRRRAGICCARCTCAQDGGAWQAPRLFIEQQHARPEACVTWMLSMLELACERSIECSVILPSHCTCLHGGIV
ncbi:hypothetical protein LIA77_09869 [Sarocladium implicatum]|nr:hypothetical protein LIA77_09869 [Sarocladium implicatum]